MKKLTLFIAMLLFAGSVSFAQSSDVKPYVTIQGVNKPATIHEQAFSTSDYITRTATLATDIPGAKVTGFTLTIMSGNTQYGPFTATGNKLTSQMLTAVKKANVGAAQVTFSNIHVNYSGKTISADNTYLRYDQ